MLSRHINDITNIFSPLPQNSTIHIEDLQNRTNVNENKRLVTFIISSMYTDFPTTSWDKVSNFKNAEKIMKKKGMSVTCDLIIEKNYFIFDKRMCEK
jgi:hypothetical protein